MKGINTGWRHWAPMFGWMMVACAGLGIPTADAGRALNLPAPQAHAVGAGGRAEGMVNGTVSGGISERALGNVLGVDPADAARFLEQSSFGVSASSLAQVQSMGIPAYLEQQLSTSATGYPSYPWVVANIVLRCGEKSAQVRCYRDNYSAFPVQLQFYQNATSGLDQLRQRVAFAYSQIFVVSAAKVYLTYGLGDYQQLLLNDAFVNFRQLLEDVTLSPAMGYYLDMVNNDGAPAAGSAPNENYAREVLQLFSLGTQQLNLDGSVKRDGQGIPIPSYTQETVEGFAHVFTGWTWPSLPNSRKLRWPNVPNLRGVMVPVEAHHDTGSKELLEGVHLPAGQDARTDLKQALDNIFQHPNVGPFIGKQLIQQLITSNPSPAYVARIASVFNNNGQGVRGDMAAVIRAILLDDEARGPSKTALDYGRPRDPTQLLIAVIRGVGGASRSDGEYLNGAAKQMLEGVFHAPSVFNFYPPDYPLQGTNLVAPSLGIYNGNTAITRVNVINRLLVPGWVVRADPTVAKATGTWIDLSDWLAAAADPDSSRLIAQINALLFHGAMSPALQAQLMQVLQSIAADHPQDRAQAALFLAFASPEFQLEQ